MSGNHTILVLLGILVGCDGGKGSTDVAVTDDTAGDEGGGSEGGGGTGGGGVDTAAADIPAMVLSSDVTWTLSFDEDAEAAGFVDCSYTRTYDAVQILDKGYLCPECEVLVEGSSIMTDGVDCYTAVFGESDDVAERTELWGLGADGVLYRTNRENLRLSELTTFEPMTASDVSIAWESDYTMDAGGAMVLSATGTMRYEEDPETLLVDPWAPRTEPYACGWEQNDPGTLNLDYVLGEGKTFPNVRFIDQCGEKLSLWDLYGNYIVMDTSQPDCGPCRNMASGAEEFAAGLRAEGIPVRVVSFLGAGLSEPWVTPDADTFNEWVDSYSLQDPVLYDEGFGYALFPDFVEDFSGEDFGYPTWLLVDPDMKLFYGNVGFGDWDSVAEVIRDDWDAR